MKFEILKYFAFMVLLTSCITPRNNSVLEIQKMGAAHSVYHPAEKIEIEGGDVGNGGFVIHKDDQYIFLDYWAMEDVSLSNSYFESLASQNFKAFNISYLAMRNLSFIDARFSQILNFEINCFRHALNASVGGEKTSFKSSSHHNPTIAVTHVNSMLVKNICPDCESELAVSFKPKKTNRTLNPIYVFPFESPKSLHEHYYFERSNEIQHQYCAETGAYYINSELIKKLDEKNIAALVIHEALWAYMIRNNYDLKASSNILPLTQFIYRIPNTEGLNSQQIEDLKEEFFLIWDSYEKI